MKILILGSEGFIGGALVTFYLTKGWEVFGADLLETATKNYHYFKTSRLSPEYDELLQSQSFYACINAAGSGNVSYSMTHPVSDFESNSLDTIRVLDGLRRFQPHCKYLHISSAAVYGNPSTLPVLESTALMPISPYGWHKLIAEKICQEYAAIFKIPIVVVRPFSVFGPGLKKLLFWDIFQKCRQVTDDFTIQLWGTGSESRDFIFIDDLVLAFDCILSRGNFSASIYNVGTGIETSVKEAALHFVKRFDERIKVQFNQQDRSGDPQNWRADVTQIQQLGFNPTITLTEGIQKLIVWMKNMK